MSSQALGSHGSGRNGSCFRELIVRQPKMKWVLNPLKRWRLWTSVEDVAMTLTIPKILKHRSHHSRQFRGCGTNRKAPTSVSGTGDTSR